MPTVSKPLWTIRSCIMAHTVGFVVLALTPCLRAVIDLRWLQWATCLFEQLRPENKGSVIRTYERPWARVPSKRIAVHSDAAAAGGEARLETEGSKRAPSENRSSSSKTTRESDRASKVCILWSGPECWRQVIFVAVLWLSEALHSPDGPPTSRRPMGDPPNCTSTISPRAWH